MRDGRFSRYLRVFMDKGISPLMFPLSRQYGLDVYKRTLIERFGNRSVSDQLARLLFRWRLQDSGVYDAELWIQMIREHVDLTRVAFFTAAYRHYLKYKVDDHGMSFEINEPLVDGD